MHSNNAPARSMHSVELPDDLWGELGQASKELGQSRPRLIAHAIEVYLHDRPQNILPPHFMPIAAKIAADHGQTLYEWLGSTLHEKIMQELGAEGKN